MPPPNTYTTTSTSSQSARVEPRVLSEGATTRRVILPTIVDNPTNPEAGIKIEIVHQRKSPRGEWESLESVPLTSLHAGETVKMPLDSAQTLALHRELQQLYAIHQGAGVPRGQQNLVVAPEEQVIVTDPRRAQAIRQMIEAGHSQEIWDQLVAENPDLVTRLSYARVQTERATVLEEFRVSMGQGKPESYWQDFFEKHTWIFGYGLNYQILRIVNGQPYYGGRRVEGSGDQRGDFLCRTEALARFTVLVDIKTPQSPMFGSQLHRNGAWSLNSELTGGVSQLQANCRTWEHDGSQEEQTQERMRAENTYTVEPDSILVIGNSSQYATDIQKRNTFEAFRQHLHKPQIITFDELYERAKFIVTQPEENAEEPTEDAETEEVVDIPF